MNTMTQHNLTPEEITQKGTEIYFNELKDILEPSHSGDYLVMEVESKEQFTNNNLLIALEEAKKKYPNKIFYIVRIGTVNRPATNYSKAKYAWIF